MKLFICCMSVALLVVSSAAKEPVKGKRELPSGSYSGPSYKYLPPGGSGGYSGGYSSGGSGGLDFGHGAGGYSGGAGADLGHGNVETYIVQSSGGKGASFGGSFGGSSSSLGGGYKYQGGGFGGGLGLGGGHKVQTVVIPSQSYGAPGVSYSNSNSYSGGHGPSIGSSYSSGASYTPSVSYGAPSASYGVPAASYGAPSASYGAPSSGSYSGSHGGSALSFGGASSHGSGLSFGGASSHGSGLSFGGASSHGSGLSFGGSSSHGGASSGGNYYTTKLSSVPSGSYGVPLAAPISSYTPNKYAGSSFGSISGGSSGPTYASGQKGLGHYSYTASKPSALHTDFISSSSSSLGGGFGGIDHHHGKAPFKPSAFLGSSQDSGSSYPSNDYLPPSNDYNFSGASGGSSYQEPATVYGAPGGGSQGGSIYEQSAPIHEAASFINSGDGSGYTNEPQQSYGVPSAPGKNYLPPSTSYGVPSHH